MTAPSLAYLLEWVGITTRRQSEELQRIERLAPDPGDLGRPPVEGAPEEVAEVRRQMERGPISGDGWW